jgi:hypothetical protein
MADYIRRDCSSIFASICNLQSGERCPVDGKTKLHLTQTNYLLTNIDFQTLEQLLSSHSVASSIKQPFLLRRFNRVAVALLILWGFSPLATQSMQRVSYIDYSDPATATKLAYLNTVNGSNHLSDPPNAFGKIQPDITRLYSAAFLPDNYNLGADFFGNALVPVLTDLPINASDDKDWYITDWINNYSSLYGLPVALPNLTDSNWASTTDADPTYNVTASTAYLTFTCSDPIITNDIGNLFNDTDSNPTLFIAMTPMHNATSGTLDLASLITTNQTTNDTDTGIPTYAYSNCTFDQTFVDVNISCQYGSCAVWAIKPSTPTSPPNFLFSGYDTAQAFLTASGAITNDVATDTERYLMYGKVIDSDTSVNLTTLSSSLFSTRLSILMNTFWQISFGPDDFTSPLINSTSNNTVLGDGARIDNFEIYRTSWGWFAALIVCSVFLLSAGVASVIWDARTISPHVLGFASNVVRKTKHVHLPPVGPAASGAERVRALGEVRVMMQDIKPKYAVGRMVLGTVGPDAQRLQVGRSYR